MFLLVENKGRIKRCANLCSEKIKSDKFALQMRDQDRAKRFEAGARKAKFPRALSKIMAVYRSANSVILRRRGASFSLPAMKHSG